MAGKRSTLRKDAAGKTDDVTRLTDMDVPVVSTVDRAANAKKFLVVKDEKGEREVEVVEDGKGGFVEVVKSDEPAAVSPAAEVKVDGPGVSVTVETPTTAAAPAAAPAPVAAAAPPAEEEPKPEEVEAEKAALEKAGRKMAKSRLVRLKAALGELQGLLKELDDEEAPPAEDDEAKKNVPADVAKSAPALPAELAALPKQMEVVLSSLSEYGKAIEKLSKSTGASAAIPIEQRVQIADAAKWPSDMNADKRNGKAKQ